RENQDDDRAGTRPHSDRDDGRETALPTARTGQFLRLRPVGMAPGRGVLVVAVVMIVMAVIVVMAMVVIVRVIMVRVIVMGMIVMSMVMPMMVVPIRLVVVMLVIVRRGHCGADRVQRPAHAARGVQESL